MFLKNKNIFSRKSLILLLMHLQVQNDASCFVSVTRRAVLKLAWGCGLVFFIPCDSDLDKHA